MDDKTTRMRKLSQQDIASDIDLMLWSYRLQKIRRWVHQPYWKEETLASEFADKLEEFPRLETVAEHSWQVADAVLLLAPSFPYIHRDHAVEIAIMHDKMEIAI